MNLTANKSQIDFYENFFELRSSIICMTISYAFITPAAVGMFYFTIWFEINGPDARRNLINRLVSPISWTCIIYFLLAQPIELLRFFYGPLPDSVCVFKLYLKNVLTIAGIFFYIFILFSR